MLSTVWWCEPWSTSCPLTVGLVNKYIIINVVTHVWRCADLSEVQSSLRFDKTKNVHWLLSFGLLPITPHAPFKVIVGILVVITPSDMRKGRDKIEISPTADEWTFSIFFFFQIRLFYSNKFMFKTVLDFLIYDGITWYIKTIIAF